MCHRNGVEVWKAAKLIYLQWHGVVGGNLLLLEFISIKLEFHRGGLNGVKSCFGLAEGLGEHGIIIRSIGGLLYITQVVLITIRTPKHRHTLSLSYYVLMFILPKFLTHFFDFL